MRCVVDNVCVSAGDVGGILIRRLMKMKKKIDRGWDVIVDILTYLIKLGATFKVDAGESFYKILIVQKNNEYVFGDVMEEIIMMLKGRCKRFAFIGKEEGIEIMVVF